MVWGKQDCFSEDRNGDKKTGNGQDESESEVGVK
jgi:hypothetical protein